MQLLSHFSLDLAKFFFPDYQQTISRRLAKPEFASEASETSEKRFTFYTLKKWDSSYLGRLRSLVFVDGFSNGQRCWKAVDEDNWLERFSRLAPLALKSAFRSLRSLCNWTKRKIHLKYRLKLKYYLLHFMVDEYLQFLNINQR